MNSRYCGYYCTACKKSVYRGNGERDFLILLCKICGVMLTLCCTFQEFYSHFTFQESHSFFDVEYTNMHRLAKLGPDELGIGVWGKPLHADCGKESLKNI